MTDPSSNHALWRDSRAKDLVSNGVIDRNNVRELLILDCHSSPIANPFFKSHLGSEELLTTLLDLATDDVSGDAQMHASYWVSQFPPAMLVAHAAALAVIAANEWESVAAHARRALAILDNSPS